MTLCHSITVDSDSRPAQKDSNNSSDNENNAKDDGPIYQCQSPDELALVKAAARAGQELVDTRENKYYIEENGIRSNYEIKAEFKFDSDRKRMSVIVEEDGKYYLYTKGADNKMKTQIKWRSDKDLTILEEHLKHFAIQGLRTLVMGRRSLSKGEYETIMSSLRKTQSSESRNKDAEYTKIYCEHEKDLEFLGASAIEDKLQDNVPDTISKLMEANIRVWVLTGDKEETAKEIARSCQLIQEDMEVIELTVEMKDLKKEPNESPEEFEDRKVKANKDYKNELKGKLNDNKETFIDKDTEINTPEEIFKSPIKNLKKRGKPLTIVIDGSTLAMILGDEELEKLFLCIGLYTKSVVCCRVSPKQKSMVVALVKKYKKRSHLSIYW